mgnify:CR=1 FL=1
MKLAATLRHSSAAIAIFLSLGAAPAFAQDAAAEPEGLQDIIVTAQRVSENQKDVPISIATLGGDALQAVSGAGADIRALSVDAATALYWRCLHRSAPPQEATLRPQPRLLRTQTLIRPRFRRWFPRHRQAPQLLRPLPPPQG